MTDTDNNYSTRYPRVEPLVVVADFPRWRRNARADLNRQDPKLLFLKDQPAVPANQEAIDESEWALWINANAIAKANIILMLSDAVQIRAIAYVDDEAKTAKELWEFLALTYTASNEQAVQNIRIKLDSLVYVEGAEWDSHLNEFNSLIAQLAMQEVSINDATKKSMLIRSLPESLSVISTVASAQPTMTIESLDALVRAELDRKKNPNNPQEKAHRARSSSIFPPTANYSQRTSWGISKPPRKNNATFKKKGKCFYCGKDSHFKRECRKLQIDSERRPQRSNQNRWNSNWKKNNGKSHWNNNYRDNRGNTSWGGF